MGWTDPKTGQEYNPYRTPELEAELRFYYAAYCKHERSELRLAPNATGDRHLRRQCMVCGWLLGNALPKSSAPADVPEEDPELRTRYDKNRSAEIRAIYQRHVDQQAQEGTDWRGRYEAYLATPEWRAKRAKVFERSNGLCEGCREAKATDAHHLTYEHMGDELLFELVALCGACHSKCHPKEELPDDDIPF